MSTIRDVARDRRGVHGNGIPGDQLAGGGRPGNPGPCREGHEGLPISVQRPRPWFCHPTILHPWTRLSLPITNPTFAESIRGVQDFAHREGYQVLLGNSDYEYAKEARLCEVLRERQIEGLIITTTDLKGKVLRDLLDDHFPFVLLYSTVKKRSTYPLVGVDNFRGGYSATEHLIHLGHRRIAMLAGGFSFSDKSLHRWHGYKKCLRDHRIPYDSAMVLQTQYALENGREGIKNPSCIGSATHGCVLLQ